VALALESCAGIDLLALKKGPANAVVGRLSKLFADFMKGFNHRAIQDAPKFALAVGR